MESFRVTQSPEIKREKREDRPNLQSLIIKQTRGRNLVDKRGVMQSGRGVSSEEKRGDRGKEQDRIETAYTRKSEMEDEGRCLLFKT